MRRAALTVGIILLLSSCSEEEAPSGPDQEQAVQTAFDGGANWVCTVVVIERVRTGWHVSTESNDSCAGAVVADATVETVADSLVIMLSIEGVSTGAVARIAQYEVVVSPPPSTGSPALLNSDSIRVEPDGMIWFLVTKDGEAVMRWYVQPDVQSYAFPLWARTVRLGFGALLPAASIDTAQSTIRNELTVTFDNDVSEERQRQLADSIAQALTAAARWTRSSTGTSVTFRWPVEAGIDRDTTVRRLAALPEIGRARPGILVSGAHGTPSDNGWPDYPTGTISAGEIFWRWASERRTSGSNWGWKAADLPLAWDCQATSRAPVAVVDVDFKTGSGFHSDLVPTAAYRADSDSAQDHRVILRGVTPGSSGHGLGVAGIIGATGDNEHGLTGVIWEGHLRLHQARGTLDEVNFADVLYLVEAALDSGAQVLNISLGYKEDDREIAEIIGSDLGFTFGNHLATGEDFLAVLAAGNQNREATESGFPAARTAAFRQTGENHVLVVGGVDHDFRRFVINDTLGSNYGDVVEIYAPGRQVELLAGQDGTESADGTSFAVAFVSGAAALLWGFDPSLTAPQVKSYLIRGARAAQKKRELAGITGTERVLNVYESLKLIAAERNNTPPCGMFSMLDEGTLRLYSITDTVKPVVAEEKRSYSMPAGFEYTFHGDLAHDYRSMYLLANDSVYRWDFLMGGYPQVVASPPADASLEDPVRSIANGNVLAAQTTRKWQPEGIDTVTSDTTWVLHEWREIAEYPGGRIVVPDLDARLSTTYGEGDLNAYGLSHNTRYFAYLGDSLSVYVTGSMSSGDRGKLIYNHTGPGRLWDVVMSPTGDALAIGSRAGLILYVLSSTVYENATNGTSHFIRLPDMPNGFAVTPHFTPDGEAVLFRGGDWGVDVCHIYYAAYRGAASDIEATQLADTPCDEPLTAPARISRIIRSEYAAAAASFPAAPAPIRIRAFRPAPRTASPATGRVRR